MPANLLIEPEENKPTYTSGMPQVSSSATTNESLSATAPAHDAVKVDTTLALTAGNNTTLFDREWSIAEDTLYAWSVRARNNVFAHQEAAKANNYINYVLGISIVVVTILSQVLKSYATISGICAALIGALAALQTFLKVSENTSKHLAAAASYSAIRRKLEVIDGTPRNQRAAISSVLKEVADAIDAASSAPALSAMVWERAVRDAEKQEARPIFIDRARSTSEPVTA